MGAVSAPWGFGEDSSMEQEQLGSYISGAVAPTQDEKTMALIGHIGGIVVPILVPLVIMMTKGKESAWVREQSVEALNFQITVFIAYVACGILTLACIGALLAPVVGIAAIVLGIIAGLKANEGISYRYPATLRLVK
jgi:hypothetical protein